MPGMLSRTPCSLLASLERLSNVVFRSFNVVFMSLLLKHNTSLFCVAGLTPCRSSQSGT